MGKGEKEVKWSDRGDSNSRPPHPQFAGRSPLWLLVVILLGFCLEDAPQVATK